MTVKKNGRQPQSLGIPLNTLDKLFYSWEVLGSRPMSRILFELRGGHIDIHILRQAYAILIQCRPVLNAIIDDTPCGSGWNVRWVPRGVSEPNKAVRLCDFSADSNETAEEKTKALQFDPFPSYSSRKDPPFFIALCKTPGGRHKLLAFVHHAVADAHGLGLIFGELFTTYNHLAAGHPIDDSECRCLPPGPSSPVPETWGRRCLKVLTGITFFTVQYIKLLGQSPAKMANGRNTFSDITSAVQREIGTERLSRYLAWAKHHGVTFNDFLITAQVAAIDRWKREHKKRCGLISVDVHKNLRSQQSELQELSNKFSTFIIYTLPRHRTDLKTLLGHVRREREQAQKRSVAEKIFGLLWILDSRIAAKTLGFWGRFMFNSPLMGDSSQITNVGRVWAGPDNTTLITRLGDAEITGCYMAALPNPSIGNYCSFVTFNNRLYVSFIYFTSTMSDAQAQRFTDIFEKTLEDLAQCS